METLKKCLVTIGFQNEKYWNNWHEFKVPNIPNSKKLPSHASPPNIALIIHMSIYRKKPELKYLSTKFENDKEKCLYQAPLENQLKLFSMEQKTVFCKTTS